MDRTGHTTLPTRLVGLDIARAWAVFGMIVVNFKMVMSAKSKEPVWLSWCLSLFEGKAAATFVVLAGIGVALMTRKAVAAEAHGQTGALRQFRWTLQKRALFLFVIGLAYSPIWPADILHFYGVYLTIALFLLCVSNRTLWFMIVGVMCTFVLLLFVLRYEQGWDFSTFAYKDFWTPRGLVRHLFFNGFHPVIPWLCFLLYGMWLGRLELRNTTTQKNMVLVGVCVAATTAGLGFVLRWLVPGEQGQALFTTGPMPPMPLYLILGASSATVLIGLCLGWGARFPQGFGVGPLVATGQMALSGYVGHILIGMGGLEMVGGLQGNSLGFAAGMAFGFFAGLMLFSWGWRRVFARGPVEFLMRWITG